MSVQYEVVIGLEVHAQLLSQTKLFCPAPAEYSEVPNAHLGPVTLGLPGALPVPNEAAIRLAVTAGLALDCEVREHSVFARKHYFYPDLPKGYQISQFDEPLNEHGHLDIELEGETRRIRILRIHVEEDAATNLHGVGSGKYTLVDYNRAGVPLIEIVSEPDLRSSEEAEQYLRRLREILMFIGVNDGNLEEGSFRCDANVSIRPVGETRLGTRTELKNINSFRFVRKAIDYEVHRQEALLNAGGEVVQETRTWSENQEKTVSMRGKEHAHDYRYFPDPDLPDLRLEASFIEACRRALPELPQALRARWQSEFGLSPYDSQVLSAHPQLAAFVDTAVATLASKSGKAAKDVAKQVANFVQTEVLRSVDYRGLEAGFPCDAAQLGSLLAMVVDGQLSGKLAKTVFAEMVEKGGDPAAIVERKGLTQLSTPEAVVPHVEAVVAEHADKAKAFREGKTGLMGFFVGQVMQRTQGRANPKLVNDLLKKALEG